MADKSKTDNRIKKIFNAFEPNVPATSKYYWDCKEARGGDHLARQIIRRLDASNGGKPLCFLFTGHIGSGKSSELLHLKEKLEKSTTFPIYIDFKNYLDEEDSKLEDIFLAIAVEVADSLEGLKIDADNFQYFARLLDKVKSYLAFDLDSVEAEFGGDASAVVAKSNFKVKAKAQRLKQNPTAREQIHQAINDDKKSLLDELNIFLETARLELKKHTSFNDLVLIADGLEKIEKFDGKSRGLESQRQLFIESQKQLTNVASHIIYTIPLSLYRSPDDGARLRMYYDKDVFVLPMVKIHKRGDFGEPYPKGIEALKEILQKRLGELTFEEIFTSDALQHLIKYSGGNIRNLLRFIQDSVVSTDNFPIDFTIAKKSVGASVRSFAASVKENRWRKLAELELNPRQQIENGDEDYAVMLENTTIFEYMNGDEDSDSEDYVWYAVNPAVRQTLKFQDALKALENQNAELSNKP